MRNKNRFRFGFESFLSSSRFKMFEANYVQVASSSQTTTPNNAGLDIVCELAWSTRDYLIYSLNRYSQLLVGKTLTADDRNEIIELNLELLSVLLGLPLKTQQNCEEPGEPVAESNEVVLDLHWQARGRLIDSLATNHSLAVLHGRSVGSDAKRKLVEQNNELVNMLLKLPARVLQQRQPDDAIGAIEKATLFEHNVGLVKRSELDERISILRKEFGEKLSLLGGQLNEQRSLLDGELVKVCAEVDEQRADLQALRDAGDLRQIVERLESKIKDVDVNRAEAVCVFRLADAAAFLRSDRVQKSEQFFLRGIAWHLNFFVAKGSEGRRYLSVSLNAVGPSELNWAIKVFYFEFVVLNECAGKASRSKQGANLIFAKGQRGYGHAECISVDELSRDGFIREDAIKVKVHLRADKLLLLSDQF